MTITVKIEHANLSELLAKVEAGEEVLLTRGDAPVARLSGLSDRAMRQKAIDEVLEFRKTMPRVTLEEVAAWKAIGRM
ncbi:type II toxin-antitoxin system prevent-host-death family antitoxin [Pseudorhizobium endolithicum]|uniref:Type II toxin-antitoxin system prevent-host-death family antitoxin n=1 Tax=Pseudorhizobium endolithicum TaxID=1191678 RepID=A0ABN7JN21_9HYPH|nr:type II toxin-antitoxin system prevent-host-death family antitoxin [Pseudorhizobium endolithicum]CAD7033660.1 type II toxin-antitoxin system prevent-host-death family antitoxin [Pseudorhizobium endolithicum]